MATASLSSGGGVWTVSPASGRSSHEVLFDCAVARGSVLFAFASPSCSARGSDVESPWNMADNGALRSGADFISSPCNTTTLLKATLATSAAADY